MAKLGYSADLCQAPSYVKESLVCGICLELAHTPVACADREDENGCSAIYCMSCIRVAVAANPHCPGCRKVNLFRDLMIVMQLSGFRSTPSQAY